MPSRTERPAARGDHRAAHWRWRTRMLALEINSAWWLDHFLVPVFLLGIVGAFSLLWVRTRRVDLLPAAWAGIALAALIAAIVSWMSARRRFESIESARVLLEDRLGLDARLSAAEAGVGEWPPIAAGTDLSWPVRIRAGRPLLHASLAAAMLAAGALVPVTDADAARSLPDRPPPDAEAVSRWVEEMREAKAVDEDAAADLSDRVAELLARPRDRWYEHSGLEAAAHLREQTAADIAALARDLAEAGSAAEALAGGKRGEARDAAARRLAGAASRLASGGLRPSEATAAALATSGPEGIAELSPERLARLAEALAANRSALRQALQRAGAFDLGAFTPGEPCPECGAECKSGKPCAKCGSRGGRDGGRGDVTRGPGTAPMTLGAEGELGTRRSERVTAPLDVERGAAGELLEVVDGDEPVNEEWAGPVDGGTAVDGDGGGAVRVDDLAPRERATLRRYFKE